MMHCDPDLNIPVDRLIINELESDSITDSHYFKCLELSATRCCMLLKHEVQDESEKMGFTSYK